MEMKKDLLPKSLVILIILNLVFFITGQSVYSQITLKNIWKERTFVPKTIRLGKSMLNGEHYTRVENNHKINVYAYSTGEFVRTLLNIEGVLIDENGETPRIDNYFFSPQEDKILLAFNTESIYRHSSESDFFIYNISDETYRSLSDNGKQRIPEFSPDGSKVAFVRDNNIFFADIKTGTEYQITTDGKYNEIINGTTDWVYEEEFGFTRGFHWSPDGKRIAYYRFDETHVKEFNMLLYGSLYPYEYRFKYPKAGESNAFVNIYFYDLENQKHIKIDTGEETDQYIPRIKWTRDPEKLAIIRLNRHQNHLEILLADARNGVIELMYDETNKYYIDITDDLTFLKDGDTFIISSEKSGFNHLYLHKNNGELIRQITQGDWDVNSFIGVDEENDVVYYTSFEESAMENHLYVSNINGKTKKKLTKQSGWHSPSFSKNYNYFINSFTTISTPPVFTINKSDGSQLRLLENNNELKQTLSEYNYVKPEFFTIQLDDGTELNGWMMKPSDFDPDSEYPLFMYVYGGPGSQTVTHRWNTFNGAWFQMLTQMGYVVVSVDNRGTGGRGEEFKKMTYLQLGKYETMDQIEAASQLAELSYIDGNRIAIFGWSYGGYLSSLCLAIGADVFDAAIAVAPVTNWRFYDTIYTERYMRTPQENKDGYDNNSPINHTEKIKGAYLLVHGSADDNVHYQNTMEMSKQLINTDVDFEMLIYPNHNHGISGGNARLHLYRQLTDFLEQNMK